MHSLGNIGKLDIGLPQSNTPLMSTIVQKPFPALCHPFKLIFFHNTLALKLHRR